MAHSLLDGNSRARRDNDTDHADFDKVYFVWYREGGTTVCVPLVYVYEVVSRRQGRRVK